jgi:hypothetical protein
MIKRHLELGSIQLKNGFIKSEVIKGHLYLGFTQLKNDFNKSEVKSIQSLALHNRAVYRCLQFKDDNK